jgi:hypothetical protein
MDEAAEDGEAGLADDDAAAMDADDAAEAGGSGGSGGDRFAGGGGVADDDRDERWQCVHAQCVLCLCERMQSPTWCRGSRRSGCQCPM